MRLLIATRSDADGTVWIHVSGEIDLDNAYQIREATDLSLADRRPRGIVIELGAVSLIDSVGIGVLVSCFYAAAAYGLPLQVANPSPLVYRQLWVCGLAGLFGLPTTGAAPVVSNGPATAQLGDHPRHDRPIRLGPVG